MAEGQMLNSDDMSKAVDPRLYSRSDSAEDNTQTWLDNSEALNNVTLDLSYQDLDGVSLQQNMLLSDENDEQQPTLYLHLEYNRLDFIPEVISKFKFLKQLDLSNNHLTEINDSVVQLEHLEVFLARNNFLGQYALPKKIGHMLKKLEVLNLSGNILTTVPPEIFELRNLKSLYLGGNSIEEISRDIWRLEKLEILYLGGNNLREIPAEMGRLHNLKSLVLCENQLQSLPSTISCLRKLKSLLLHKNQLTTLPPEIVTLKSLVELSLRDNPLVVRFVEALTYDPPSLQELAARCIKLFRVQYSEKDVPQNLLFYLQSACRCVNPRCRGVYFDVRVEHIKFVDFCGKYRIPLLQYLCSPRCSIHPAFHGSDSNSSDDDNDCPRSRLKRVLLG